MSERRGPIHTAHTLPKTRRCELLEVARSSAYYRPTPISDDDLRMMRVIDEIHLQLPFYGSRRLRDELQTRGHSLNRKRVQRLMRQTTAAWTLQQLREAFPSEHEYRFLIHDRDSIFSKALDKSIGNLRLRVLKTPYRAPQANAVCERFIGTLRREFLDWVIPLSENHIRRLLQIWLAHYNGGRPHMSLGPGVPDPPPGLPVSLQSTPHSLADGFRVVSRPLLGGLHHEYNLMPHAT